MKRALILAAPAIFLIVCAGAVFFFGGNELAGIVSRISPGCPTRRFFGIACPGCGGTRALYALLRGDFLAAIRFNPWWIPSAGILLGEWLFFAFPKIFTARGERIRIALIKIYAVSTLAFWLLRNIFNF